MSKIWSSVFGKTGLAALAAIVVSITYFALRNPSKELKPTFSSIDQYFAHFGQTHILRRIQKLSGDESKLLKQQCSQLDLEDLSVRFKELQTSTSDQRRDVTLSPMKASVSTLDPTFDTDHYRQEGLLSISRGEVAILLLGGGQGTRLNSRKPKALYDLNLPSHKTLLQIQAERISRLRTLASAASSRPLDEVRIPWCIMSNDESFGDIRDFLERKLFFGLPPEDIFVFQQGMLPVFDMKSGEILLSSPNTLALSPNGNGGVYDALHRSGVLQVLSNRNVKALHMHNVDNVLTKVGDPTAFGLLFADPKLQIVVKSVARAHANEAVGVFALRNGKPSVAEYSEIPLALAEARENDGVLTYNEANIGSTFLKLDFITTNLKLLSKLPWHAAKKSVAHFSVDQDGDVSFHPKASDGTVNALKMELYNFDAFECLHPNEILVFNVAREDEFAPVKNADREGARDTPTTARLLLSTYYSKLLTQAGASITSGSRAESDNDNTAGQSEPAPEPVIEVSPLVSYDGEGLEFVQGMVISGPMNLEM